MKKRVVAMLTVVTLLAGLSAGCAKTGGQDGGSGNAGKTDKEAVTLNVILSENEQTKDMLNYFDQFEEETGIKINYEIMAESSYMDKMMLGLSSNNQQYDVVMASPATIGTILDGGWVQPLDQYIEDDSVTDKAWREGLADSMLSLAVVDGKRYAVPYNMGVNILYYNKAMFRDAGLDPENPPTTLEDILKAARTLNAPDKNQYGISFRASREGNANTFLWAMLWMICGGSWEDAEGLVDYSRIGGKEAVEATDFFAEFHEYAPAGISSYGYEEAQLAFQQGLSAMWIDTSILANGVLDSEESQVAEDVGFAAFTEGHAIGSPWMFLMASKTEHPTEAWKFLQFVSGYELQMEQVKSGVQTGPVRTDVLGDPKIGEYFNEDLAEAVNYALEHDPISNYFPAINEMTEIRSLLAIQIADVALGKTDSQSAIDQLWKDVEELLKREGVIE
ncbi:MAG: sugar ABC transporter substrate-binding protein [Lachnospiraceae bacterium]